MGALKLECFTNSSVDTTRGSPLLQDFDSARAQAFADGIKSGADATSKAFEAEKLRLLTPILESLNDIGFSQIEAGNAILHSLRPLIDTMIGAILPHAAKQGFADEVAALVHQAAEKSVQGCITVSVPPDAVEAISAMLASTTTSHQVVADAALPDLSAIVTWGTGFDRIDLIDVQQQIQSAVDEFYTTYAPATKTGTYHD